MKKLEFKRWAENRFFSDVNNFDPINANYTVAKLVNPTSFLLCLDHWSTHEDGDRSTSLVIYSNDANYPERRWIHKELEAVLDTVQAQSDLVIRSLLWYHVNWGIRKKYIDDHQHRALFVGEGLRWRWAWQLMYKTMNQLKWVSQKETTYVPSLLHFHMQKWFEVSRIHIITWSEDLNPVYELSDQQKRWIEDYICWAYENGDLSLPFFVELKHTGNKFSKRPQSEWECPWWLMEIISKVQVYKDNYRSFIQTTKQWQRFIEDSMGLDKQGLSTLEWIRDQLLRILRLW